MLAPTLIMVSEQNDRTPSNLDLFDDRSPKNKVFFGIACGTHFTNWEKQRRVLHRASADWLKNGSLKGATTVMFRADEKAAVENDQEEDEASGFVTPDASSPA